MSRQLQGTAVLQSASAPSDLVLQASLLMCSMTVVCLLACKNLSVQPVLLPKSKEDVPRIIQVLDAPLGGNKNDRKLVLEFEVSTACPCVCSSTALHSGFEISSLEGNMFEYQKALLPLLEASPRLTEMLRKHLVQPQEMISRFT